MQVKNGNQAQVLGKLRCFATNILRWSGTTNFQEIVRSLLIYLKSSFQRLSKLIFYEKAVGYSKSGKKAMTRYCPISIILACWMLVIATGCATQYGCKAMPDAILDKFIRL
ncbi:MAG: hypothetical protein EPN89_18705 [Methylovulum sp.]|nr:MAG: hypothetical protein EPN89_18705 [Methylovulum sp.]